MTVSKGYSTSLHTNPATMPATSSFLVSENGENTGQQASVSTRVQSKPYTLEQVCPSQNGILHAHRAQGRTSTTGSDRFFTASLSSTAAMMKIPLEFCQQLCSKSAWAQDEVEDSAELALTWGSLRSYLRVGANPHSARKHTGIATARGRSPMLPNTAVSLRMSHTRTMHAV